MNEKAYEKFNEFCQKVGDRIPDYLKRVYYDMASSTEGCSFRNKMHLTYADCAVWLYNWDTMKERFLDKNESNTVKTSHSRTFREGAKQ